MTFDELANLLSQRYNETPRGEVVLQVQLFVIEHEADIRQLRKGWAWALVQAAGIGNLSTAMDNALLLSRHVMLRA